jgi:hypothetical protein
MGIDYFQSTNLQRLGRSHVILHEHHRKSANSNPKHKQATPTVTFIIFPCIRAATHRFSLCAKG